MVADVVMLIGRQEICSRHDDVHVGEVGHIHNVTKLGHMGVYGVLNYQQLGYLFNSLFKLTTKKTPRLRINDGFVGKHESGGFP